MALKNNDNTGNCLFLKVVDKKDKVKVPVHFSITENGGVDEAGKTVYKTREETVKIVTGDLTKVSLKDKTWEGNEYKVINVTLRDAEANEFYVLDLRYNMLSRSLFNSLVSLNGDYSNLEISLYNNKEGYSSVGVKKDGERLDWKFKADEMPKVLKQKVGKKEVIDTSELDEFWTTELTKLSERLEKAKPSKAAPKVSEPETDPDLDVTDEDGEEIPF